MCVTQSISSGIFDSLERQSINQTILFEAVVFAEREVLGTWLFWLLGWLFDWRQLIKVCCGCCSCSCYSCCCCVVVVDDVIAAVRPPVYTSSSSSLIVNPQSVVHHPASYSAPYHMLVGAKCAACLLAATWAGLNGPNWLYCVGICMCAGSGCDGMT